MAIGLFVIVVGSIVALLAPGPNNQRPLSPLSSEKSGSKALAQVLQGQGVEVQVPATFGAVRSLQGRDRTLLVIGGGLLGKAPTRELAKVADRVVLVEPSEQNLADLGLPLTIVQASMPPGVTPDCSWPAARNAGPSELDGVAFRSTRPVPGGTTLCYPVPTATPGDATGGIAVVSKGGVQYVLVGSESILRNDAMKDPGHAALGLWTLGAHRDLVWWVVDPFDGSLENGGKAVDPTSLLPGWLDRVQLWLLVGAGLAVLWKWRRMGRLVAEPLPVVVRSAETAHGRAALYRRAGARDRAAAVLRADALRRIARRRALPASSDAALVARAAASAAGWDPVQVLYILTGPPPADDRQLTALVSELDRLVAAVAGDHLPPRQSDPTRKATQ